ncbi:unnamed protein product [Brachionus calyciflorus]|uniref:Reverse transcriptase domain-containing protein n=1 Tax=Brachionus calyciflorus TaxID=104777 RepID=A0A814RWN1_9BILA|nr:unnamed protein product [Brachionus calyciflorus]
MGKFVSDFKKLRFGVPQGSVLGPLFFLIFINDLSFCMEVIKCKLFADDTTIYHEGDDLDKLLNDFKNLLRPFFDWCLINRLEVNWSKTYIMVITNKRVKNLKNLKNVNLGTAEIEVVDNFKLLGVSIDSKLNFEYYVSQLRLQINRKLYSIKKLFSKRLFYRILIIVRR